MLACSFTAAVSRAATSACTAIIHNGISTFSKSRLEARMLIQKPNPMTGGYEWVVVDTAGDGGPEDASADLVAASSYLDMLTDARRNRAYAMALDRVLRSRRDIGMYPAVLDIGTGTGLLAMMACQSLQGVQQSQQQQQQQQQQHARKRVLACEVFPPMARVAERVIAANRLNSNIRVVCRRSDELVVESAADSNPGQAGHVRQQQTQPDISQGGVSVVVSEILDSALLGEGVLPTMRHAAAHLMQQDAQAIPAGATMWGQLVECSTLWSMASLQPLSTAQGIAMQSSASSAGGLAVNKTGAETEAQLKSVLRKVVGTLQALDAQCIVMEFGNTEGNPHAGLAWQDLKELHVGPLWAAGLLTPLSAPFQLLSIDLAHPLATNTARRAIQVPIIHMGGGQLHALVFWWQLFLDSTPGTDLVLSTAPPWVGSSLQTGGDGGPLAGVAQQWRDHWAQCWAPLGEILPQQVLPGQVVDVSVRHDDISVQVALAQQAPAVSCQLPQLHGVSSSAVPALRRWLAPHLIAQLQEEQRWLPYMRALQPLLHSAGASTSPSGSKDSTVHSHQAVQQRPQQGVDDACVGMVDIVTLGAGIMLPMLAASLVHAAHHLTEQGHTSSDHCISRGVQITALVESPVEQQWIQAAAQALQLDTNTMRITKPSVYWKRLQHAGNSSSASKAAEASSTPRTIAVLSEPRFMEAEGGLPWVPMLRCWNDMISIRQAHPDACVVCTPSHAVMRCVAVSMPELWRSRTQLTMVEGLDLSAANSMLGAVGAVKTGTQEGPAASAATATAAAVPHPHVDGFTPCFTLDPLPCALWQCGDGPACTELSSRQELARLATGHLDIDDWEGSTELCIASSSQPVHAVALWVDYEAWTGATQGSTAAEVTMVSNAPRQNGAPTAAAGKQGLLLLRQPIPAGVTGRLRVHVQFDKESCDIRFTIGWRCVE